MSGVQVDGASCGKNPSIVDKRPALCMGVGRGGHGFDSRPSLLSFPATGRCRAIAALATSSYEENV